MPASHELRTLKGLSKQAWLTPQEQVRFRDIVIKWVKDNPNMGAEKEMLFEGLVRCHLWEQRLIDNRVFFDGSSTDYRVDSGRKTASLGAEDQQRKDREWLTYMPLVQRWKIDHLKLALANSIDVQVVNDLSSLFGALDATDHNRIKQYKGSNGEA